MTSEVIKGHIRSFYNLITTITYILMDNFCLISRNTFLTRTKTSIRYAKESDGEKRERRREIERKVEGERER